MSGIFGSSSSSSENLVINPTFDFWQRGNSFTGETANIYCADRWAIYAAGATISANRQACTSAEKAILGSTYYARVQATAASINWGFRQIIPDLTRFSNKTLTIKLMVKMASASSVRIWARERLASNIEHLFYFDVGTDWQEITCSFKVSDLEAASLGDNQLYLTIQCDNNETNTLDIANVSITEGDVDFQHPELGAELRKCKRYYQKTYWSGKAPASNELEGMVEIGQVQSASGIAMVNNVNLPIEMHTNPTISIYDKAGNSNKVTQMLYDSTAKTFTDNKGTITISDISRKSFWIAAASLSGATKGKILCHYVAEAEL